MGLRQHLVDRMLADWAKNDAKRFAGKQLPQGVAAEKDIPYADDLERGHMLDIYYPERHDGKLPVLIDVHGGGFMSGDKELNRLFGFHMAQRGFLVFNINYRLAQLQIKVTDQIKDISLATKWINEHLKLYGGDADRVFLCGHSAGAVLAVMEALISKSPGMKNLFDTTSGGFAGYQGIALDCGMMTFYEKTVGYWGMRSMVFDKRYNQQEYYKSMIWNNNPELALLPKVYLISNQKDELKHMTLHFKRILDEKRIESILNFQNEEALGHMAIIYNPAAQGEMKILDAMADYLLGI